MPRKKVLVLAYACHPTNGSEPHLGWNVVNQLARYYSVVCLVSGKLDEQQEALEQVSLDNVEFVYADLPSYLENKVNVDSHDIRYYLTQFFWRKEVKRLHKLHNFDAALHATFGRYWMPSALAALDIPKVFGPMGGGEKCPKGLIKDYGFKNRLVESIRYAIPEIIQFDPFFNYNIQTWDYALGTTGESSYELKKLGFTNVKTQANTASNVDSIFKDVNDPSVRDVKPDGVKFVSIARILYWKGIHYALKAMADIDPTGWSYDIAGDGPYLDELKKIVAENNMTNVNFVGRIKRKEALKSIKNANALIHPSLHDSGSFVVQEAMALNTFAIYLKCGGPQHLCGGRFGYGVRTDSTRVTVKDLQTIIQKIIDDPESFKTQSRVGTDIVKNNYTYDRFGVEVKKLLDKAMKRRISSSITI